MSRSVEQPPSPLPIRSFFERTGPKTWGTVNLLLALTGLFLLLALFHGNVNVVAQPDSRSEAKQNAQENIIFQEK